MSALAGVDDLADRLGKTLVGADAVRAQSLLVDASAKVRSYTGQDINLATTTTRLRVRNGRSTLPQRPIVSITSVVDVNGVAITGYQQRGDVLYFGSVLLNEWEIEPRRTALKLIDVTYVHGFDDGDIPEILVAIVCQVAGRAFGTPSTDAGVTQENMGSYGYQLGTAAGSGPVGLLPDEKAELDAWKRELGLASYAQ